MLHRTYRRAVRPPRDLLARIEAMNLRGRERHWNAMPAALGARLGARMTRIGDGLATLLARSDSLQQNRMIALGHAGQVRESMLDQAIAFYRAAGVKRF